MTAPQGYDSLFFEEIDGQRRRVLLKGTEAPKGHARSSSAFTLGGKLRSQRTYEAGGDAPTRHTTNTEEADLEFTIELRDSLTGDVGRALERFQLIDSIRIAARPIRIVWGRVVRRGVLAEVRGDIESAGDIPVHLRFEIDDQGEASLRKPFRRRKVSIPSSLDGVSETLAAVKSLVTVPTLDLGIGAAVLELYGACVRPLDGLLSLAASFETGIADTFRAVDAVIAGASALLNRLKDLGAFIGALSGNDVITIDDAKARADWFAKRTAAEIALRQAVAQVQRLGVDMEARKKGQTSGRIYEVRAGDTVEAIAFREGVSVEAIRTLNPGLPVGALTAGTRVKLP